MTRRTTIGSDGSMLECERPLFVRMAAETTGLIQTNIHHLRAICSAMRVVTIGAVHCAFGNLVTMGTLELCPRAGVTTRTNAVRCITRDEGFVLIDPGKIALPAKTDVFGSGECIE